jgi:hypothetical protein
MSAQHETFRSWRRTAIAILATYVLAGGVVSLAGWFLDVPRLTDWDNNGISIQPNAALAVACAGAALLLVRYGYHRSAAIAGGVVAFMGASVILEYLSGIDFGVDTMLLFGRTWGSRGVLSPGRMGPPGATSWTIIGVALVLLSVSSRSDGRSRAAVPQLALITIVISSASIIGYLYQSDPLYANPTLTVIALQTSTFIFAVSLGLVLSVADKGPTRLLSDAGPAGLLARRILPAVVLIPILLGLARLAGDRAGLYDVAFGTAIRTVIEIGLLAALLWWTADAVRRQADQRLRSERTLRE